jgi:hypothetical protein
MLIHASAEDAGELADTPDIEPVMIKMPEGPEMDPKVDSQIVLQTVSCTFFSIPPCDKTPGKIACKQTGV